MNESDRNIFTLIELVYRRYHRREFIGHDPVGFLEVYPRKEDREIVGLIAAMLAFGRVEQIHKKVKELLSLMGREPRSWVENFHRSEFNDIQFRHRFVKIEDITLLFERLRAVVGRWYDLETCFKEAWSKSGRDMLKALGIFRAVLVCDSKFRSQMFLPDPSKGSSCKRWMLFLRWMVRKDEIDPGGWNSSIGPEDLIVPLDVHMVRVSRMLGFSKRKTIDWHKAVEITNSLKRFNPNDPVKYDFSLTRWSMEGFPALDF